ncbi:MAG TPA: colanic acid biosynthesis glycosyltransferase WcaL, partial [Ruania sp.]|nr:colanic acid biosynthesis glycosyltransferase WcaL [Ruania sp.]
MLPSDPVRIGYVTKMYPRFSETFIVNEVLALERAGLDLEIISLRPPADGRFHETLSQVRAPVSYLSRHVRAQGLWERLERAHQVFPGLTTHLGDLLELEADDAVSALELAMLVQERGLVHLHAHFASVATAVARVAAAIAGIEYSFTAHAKDIFHESVDPVALRRRLADARCVVTVSDYNL